MARNERAERANERNSSKFAKPRNFQACPRVHFARSCDTFPRRKAGTIRPVQKIFFFPLCEQTAYTANSRWKPRKRGGRERRREKERDRNGARCVRREHFGLKGFLSAYAVIQSVISSHTLGKIHSSCIPLAVLDVTTNARVVTFGT